MAEHASPPCPASFGDQPRLAIDVVHRRRRRPRRGGREPARNDSSVNRKDSSRTLAVLVTSVSESVSAKTIRSYSLGASSEERPAVVDVDADARVVVGTIGMEVAPDAGDHRDRSRPHRCARCPRLSASAASVPAAGADDQDAVERPIREPAIDLAMELACRRRSFGGDHRLVPDAVRRTGGPGVSGAARVEPRRSGRRRRRPRSGSTATRGPGPAARPRRGRGRRAIAAAGTADQAVIPRPSARSVSRTAATENQAIGSRPDDGHEAEARRSRRASRRCRPRRPAAAAGSRSRPPSGSASDRHQRDDERP